MAPIEKFNIGDEVIVTEYWDDDMPEDTDAAWDMVPDEWQEAITNETPFIIREVRGPNNNFFELTNKETGEDYEEWFESHELMLLKEEEVKNWKTRIVK